jgi:hypothetical protein
VGAGSTDGFGSVPCFGDDGEVGFVVQDEAHSAAYQGVVVGDQDAGVRSCRCVPFGHGDGQADFGAAARDGTEVEVRVDEEDAFAHATDPGAIGYGLIAWFNMVAIALPLPIAPRALQDHERQLKEGLDPVFDPVSRPASRVVLGGQRCPAGPSEHL